MSIEALRQQVLDYAATLRFEYPLCLDAEMKDRIDAASAHLIELRSEPERATLARNPIKQAEAELAALEELAAEKSIVLKWRRATPDEYQSANDRAREAGGDKADAFYKAITPILTAEFFLDAYSHDGEPLGFTWPEISASGVLNSGDMDAINLGLINFNRTPARIPFSQGTSGPAATS